MATKKSAPAKGVKKSTAIVPWNEKFAAYAKQSTEQVKDIGGGGTSVAFGHNDITVAGKSVGKTIQVIVLGSTPHNRWFGKQYDKDDKQPPLCYAFAPLDSEHPGLTLPGNDANMAPHPAVKGENRQAEKCCDCDKNVFGTATVGTGKACANTIRMGVLLADDVEDSDTAKSAEMANASVSPTNLKHWKKYVDMLADDHGRPPWAVITEITSHDDKETQIRLEFKMVDPIEDDGILEELEKRFLKIQEVLQVPYSVAAEKKPKKPKVGAGKSGKFAGGKAKR